MNKFITIIRIDDGGLASYTINENKDSYTAALIKSTSATAVPEEVVIERQMTQKPIITATDPIINKLITAINKIEEIE